MYVLQVQTGLKLDDAMRTIKGMFVHFINVESSNEHLGCVYPIVNVA